MKTRNKVVIYFIVIILIVIFALAFSNLAFLKQYVSGYLSSYGYLAVFVLSFLSDIIDQPVGPDTIGSLGIGLGLNPYFVFILAILGSWAINVINFYIGRKYISRKISTYCETGEYGNYCKFFHKYGKLSFLFSALFFPYIIMIWISGAFHMKFRDFFLYGMLPRAIRIGLVLFVVKMVFGF